MKVEYINKVVNTQDGVHVWQVFVCVCVKSFPFSSTQAKIMGKCAI